MVFRLQFLLDPLHLNSLACNFRFHILWWFTTLIDWKQPWQLIILTLYHLHRRNSHLKTGLSIMSVLVVCFFIYFLTTSVIVQIQIIRDITLVTKHRCCHCNLPFQINKSLLIPIHQYNIWIGIRMSSNVLLHLP